VMEACSMSKPFFGYMFLKLVEQGEFELDRPLVEYLEADYLEHDRRHREITARMVLSHTSGLPNWREGGWRSGNDMKLEFDPGARFRYSGEGFLMLQRAVEKKLGEGLDELSRKALIEPLELRHSRFVWDDHFLVRASCGHDGRGRVKPGRRYFHEANGAYTLYTSAEDYAKFLVEVMRSDRSATHSLSSEMCEAMLSPESHRDDQQADWGLGWGIRKSDQGRQVYHNGSNGTGFECYSEFCPESGDGVVIMTNAVGGRKLWEGVMEEWR
jgi:CubicO group peptidase (beta-lactamase class C family)